MQNRKEKKGILFGADRPVICVPVVERIREDILRQVKGLAVQGVPMVEWRIDWYEKGTNLQAVRELLLELAHFTERTLLLCTYRTRGQGGEGALSHEDCQKLNVLRATRFI